MAGGAVAALIKVLNEGPDDAKSNAAWALGDIAFSEKHVDAVVTAGAIATVIKVGGAGRSEAM